MSAAMVLPRMGENRQIRGLGLSIIFDGKLPQQGELRKGGSGSRASCNYDSFVVGSGLRFGLRFASIPFYGNDFRIDSPIRALRNIGHLGLPVTIGFKHASDHQCPADVLREFFQQLSRSPFDVVAGFIHGHHGARRWNKRIRRFEPSFKQIHKFRIEAAASLFSGRMNLLMKIRGNPECGANVVILSHGGNCTRRLQNDVDFKMKPNYITNQLHFEADQE